MVRDEADIACTPAAHTVRRDWVSGNSSSCMPPRVWLSPLLWVRIPTAHSRQCTGGQAGTSAQGAHAASFTNRCSYILQKEISTGHNFTVESVRSPCPWVQYQRFGAAVGLGIRRAPYAGTPGKRSREATPSRAVVAMDHRSLAGTDERAPLRRKAWDALGKWIASRVSRQRGVHVPNLFQISFRLVATDDSGSKLRRPVFLLSERFADNFGVKQGGYVEKGLPAPRGR